MPEAKKVSWAQLRIGIMASISMVILERLDISAHRKWRSVTTSNATLYTLMDDSAAMAASTTVRLNGISIGEIDTIELTGSNRKFKKVRIKMKVKHRMLSQIPEDSIASVDAANLLGEKFLNIDKERVLSRSKMAAIEKRHGETFRADETSRRYARNPSDHHCPV